MNNKILVVDDSALMRNLIKKILIANNYNIIGEASNGKEAVKLYQELKPDIVTMDITMPIIDGIAALKNIKSIDSNAKVIMVTAMGQSWLVTEALKADAIDFIIKPFQEESVIKTIKNHI